jgi:enoyl-CoA hydratase/carnithine racemase
MMLETLQQIVDGPVGRIVLSRPNKRNALSRRALHEIRDAARWFENEHPEVRVVVIEGEGTSFCGGADLEDFAKLLAHGDIAEAGRDIARLGQEVMDAIRGMTAITVASAHGHAIGGGFLLMAACDFRVATEDLVMAVPELALGIPLTWGGVPLMVAELGPGRTRDLIMTGRRWTTEEGLNAGFIQRVATERTRKAVTAYLVRALLEKPVVPMAMTRAQLRRNVNEVELMAEAMSHPGFRAAAAAYLKKIKR